MPKEKVGRNRLEKNGKGPRKMTNMNRGHKKGQGALRAGSAFKTSAASNKVGRPNEAAANKQYSSLRSKSTINRINLYKDKPDMKKMKEQPLGPCRIAPDRRWFGNTRVIAQNKMQTFRETLSKSVDDPFSVVLKSSKLPMSLLKDTEQSSKMNLLSVEPYDQVFGKRGIRKRVKLGSYDMEELIEASDNKMTSYSDTKDVKAKVGVTGTEKEETFLPNAKNLGQEIFDKGTSRRIWGELYKVVDSSDILCFVLDVRDPQGTRCLQLEREIKKNHRNKHIVFVLNKVDLVPTWVTRRWIEVLSKEFPTIGFHASITNPFGKSSLLNLLRQFGTLLKERKHVTVGLVGYPNVGKSSVINTLKKKKVCKAAPVPGETKVWQYISLTKRIYCVDCPGIVPMTGSDFKNDCAKLLKGVVRAERIQSPSDYIDEVVSRVKRVYLCKKYSLPMDTTFKDGEEFLTILGQKMGKLLKGGEVDLETTARVVLFDWQRGRIPFFTAPPEEDGSPAGASASASAGASAGAATNSAAPGAEPLALTEEAEGAPKPVRVEQSLAELAGTCAMEFDEEDRRGEALAIVPADGAVVPAARGEKRKGLETPGGERPKKKNRRGGGGSKLQGACSNEGAPAKPRAPLSVDAPANAPPPPITRRGGMIDWAKVTAEFSM